jgi:CubicO group peptidase (beta-lactamase class C family)
MLANPPWCFFTVPADSAITRKEREQTDLNTTAPISAFTNQDERFPKAFAILRAAISDQAFPAASVAVTHKGSLIARKTLGHFVYQGDLDRIKNPGTPLLASFARSGDFALPPDTLFDLASVTKAVATTTMAAILYERGLLELDAPISGVIPEFLAVPDPRRNEVTFRMLLAHSSGLPAYERLFLKHRTRNELLEAAFITPLTADPGTRAEYSDIGFIILGTALERLAEESIDRFCQREVFGPLAMSHTTFNPPQEVRNQIVPTANDRALRQRVIQGEVQDENAFVLGGVAGHAGLFSTAEDVARFAHAVLETNSLLCPETIALFTRRESTPRGTSRALGWDTPSSPSQSGKYFGPRSFGHLGYTGTSLWIDPDRQLSITLLTNRTWPDCANQAIKQVRPQFHDAIIEAVER